MSRFKLSPIRFDPRSVALFRSACGLIILAMIASRLSRFRDFYGADGLMPLSDTKWWVAHCWFDSDIWIYFLMGVTALCALIFAMGWFSRASGFILLYLSLAHNVRFPEFHGGYETYLPWFLLLYFVMSGSRFGPWAYAAFTGMTYWMAGIGKNSLPWIEGEALRNYFYPSAASQPLAHWLSEFPEALRVLTWIVPWFEVLIPFVLLAALLFRAQAALIALMMLFHLVILVLLNVSDISFMCLLLWLPFLPEGFWTRMKWHPRLVNAKSWLALDVLAWILIGLTLSSAIDFSLVQSRVRETSFGWDQLANLGLTFRFQHFRGGYRVLGWIQVLGRSSNWSEIVLPTHQLIDPQEVRPQDVFSDRLGRDRMWLKVNMEMDSKRASRNTFARIERYLCKNYGPETESQMVVFEWIRHSYDRPEPRRIHRHKCGSQ